ILFLFRPQIDVYDIVIRLKNRCEIGSLKGEIEHVAVEAPVRAKNQQQPFVFFYGFFFSFLDLRMGVGICRVNVFLHAAGLFQMWRICALDRDQPPLSILLLPRLVVGKEDGLAISHTGRDLGAKNETDVSVAGLVANNTHLNAARLESEPESDISIYISRDGIDAYLGGRVGTVKSFQNRGIPGNNGALPLLKRNKGIGGRIRTLSPSGHAQKQEQNRNHSSVTRIMWTLRKGEALLFNNQHSRIINACSLFFPQMSSRQVYKHIFQAC